MSKSKQPDSGSNSSTASLDRQLTEADLKNGDYECISGGLLHGRWEVRPALE